MLRNAEKPGGEDGEMDAIVLAAISPAQTGDQSFEGLAPALGEHAPPPRQNSPSGPIERPDRALGEPGAVSPPEIDFNALVRGDAEPLNAAPPTALPTVAPPDIPLDSSPAFPAPPADAVRASQAGLAAAGEKPKSDIPMAPATSRARTDPDTAFSNAALAGDRPRTERRADAPAPRPQAAATPVQAAPDDAPRKTAFGAAAQSLRASSPDRRPPAPPMSAQSSAPASAPAQAEMLERPLARRAERSPPADSIRRPVQRPTAETAAPATGGRTTPAQPERAENAVTAAAEPRVKEGKSAIPEFPLEGARIARSPEPAAPTEEVAHPATLKFARKSAAEPQFNDAKSAALDEIAAPAAQVASSVAPSVAAFTAEAPSPASPLTVSVAAPATNVSPGQPISLVAAPPPVAAAIEAISTSDGDGAIEIALDPPELGRVTIELRVSPGGVEATLTAERGEVLEMLRRHAEHLRQALADGQDAGVALSFEHGDQRDARSGGRMAHAPTDPGNHSSDAASERSLPPPIAESGRLDQRL